MRERCASRTSAVQNILQKGLDQVPDLPERSGQMHFDFPEAPRFQRDTGALLRVEVDNG